MKRIFSRFLALTACLCMSEFTVMSVCADTITAEPDLPLFGNVCGVLNITSNVPRDINIEIKQMTSEGDDVYYDMVIPGSDEEDSPDSYSFEVFGKDDSPYTLTISMQRYTDSEEILVFSKVFTVADTDFITDKKINKYIYEYTIERNDALEEPEFTTEIGKFYMDEDNNQHMVYTLSLPVAEILSGDVNRDKIIDVFDAIAVAQYTVGKTQFDDVGMIAADYNSDGNVDVFDAIGIAKYTVS
ncbi:MAG: dockerin type I repeat-containing protein [Porcipelethomonas sp.]